MGDMLIVENQILPLGVQSYAVARDSELNRLFRKTFELPEPSELIKILNIQALTRVDECVLRWYENWLKDNPETQ